MANKNSFIGILDLPIGYRFSPTDEELMKYYLMNKVFLRPIPVNLIQDIHADKLYSKSPKSLVENMDNQKEWYFFIHQDDYFRGKIIKIKMVGNEIGCWKFNDEEVPIYNSEGILFGFKINFTYFSGSFSIAKKTHWRMQVYRVPCEYTTHDDQREEWVLGRITRGSDCSTNYS